MPRFAYTVINKENRQLNGNINAPDEVTARRELNALGFSIVSLYINPETDTPVEETLPENIIKFEFSATDKAGKNIVGTIQGEEIYAVFKRLVNEYQFEVHYLYPFDLPAPEKIKAQERGVEELKDKLYEDKMELAALQAKSQIEQQEFELRKENLKQKVDFVLNKVNSFLSQYAADIKPEHKNKIKYLVDKVLRIKNSTNLEYVKESCQSLLQYIQQQELFIHTNLHTQEKNQLNLEMRGMMLQIKSADKKEQQDIFDQIRKWRNSKISGQQELPFYLELVDAILSIFLGSAEISPEKMKLLDEQKANNSQIKAFLQIWLQSKEPEIKAEAWRTVMRLLAHRKKIKQDLRKLDRELQQLKIQNVEFTFGEKVFHELYHLCGWILVFYIFYYFLSIFLSTKDFSIPGLEKLPLIFQTTVIKYFFLLLFLFVSLAGVKVEFFKRKKWANPPLIIIFIFSSLLLTLNY